jgi:hypothetical protein
MAISKIETKELKKLRADNAHLRSENRRLEKLMANQQNNKQRDPRPSQLLRRLSVVTLVIIATTLLTVGNLVFWFGNTIVKPDRFVAATQPIIKNQNVQQSMALYTTNNIFKNIDVEKITEQVLPPRADFLAPQLTSQLKTVTQKTIQTTLAKPSFQDKWNAVLASQHEKFINFASKYNGDGSISLNDVYNQLEASLQNSKLAFLAGKKLPPKIGSVTVVNATWLPAFHNLVVNIDTWRLLSVILLVLCVALAVWLSRNRRKTLYILCASASIFMLITLVALRLTREIIAGKTDQQYTEGIRSALQIFIHPLVLQTTTIFIVFVFVTIITWVSSSAKSAVVTRDKVGLLFSGKLHNRLFRGGNNKYADWVGHNKHILQWGAVAVIAIIMLVVRLTLKSLIIYALLMLLSVLAIEVVAGRTNVSLSTKS